MNEAQRREIAGIITKREALRHISRMTRFFNDPVRALPYYVFAFIGHIKPFPLTFKTLWGTNMTCYLPEGNTFYYYGYCEANLTNFILRHVKKDSIFFDIGAHVGFYTMLTSQLIEKGGQVHSFEPTPWTHKLLKKNTQGLTNVTLNNKAVSDRQGSTTFADYGPGYGAYNSAHPAGASAFIQKKSTTVTVETITLDAYCAEKQIHPDFIKLDAEGLEYTILQGMSFLLTERPACARPLITVEVAGGKEWAENMKLSTELLFSKGFVVYEIAIDGSISPHVMKESYEYDNLLFIPKERINEYDTN